MSPVETFPVLEDCFQHCCIFSLGWYFQLVFLAKYVNYFGFGAFQRPEMVMVWDLVASTEFFSSCPPECLAVTFLLFYRQFFRLLWLAHHSPAWRQSVIDCLGLGSNVSQLVVWKLFKHSWYPDPTHLVIWALSAGSEMTWILTS